MNGMGRRDLLRLGGMSVLVGATTGCGFFELAPAKAGGAPVGPKGREAPMLAELVRRGELPPVEARLPKNPLVVQPNSRIGNYGGEWHTAILGSSDWPWLGRTVGHENLTRWTVDWTGTIPNLAEEFHYNNEATELTFRLREGLRWSDGVPFTADDIVFAQNDVFNDGTLYPNKAADQATAVKIDDLTVRLVFPEPNGLFASYDNLAYQIVNKPLHYLRKFHKKYNPDADELARQEGHGGWIELFDAKAGTINPALHWHNPEMPTLYPWKLMTSLGTSNRVILERNPYYWKVDPEGSQLPYIDRVVFAVLLDEEVMLTRALNGDFDMHMRHFTTQPNKPVLAHNRAGGGYRFFETDPGEMNTCLISLNLTHQDPVKREIFNNKDFRIGLSYAINRPEIIQVVYQGRGEPWQAAPRRQTPFFNERLAKQYTEYDVALANEHLDRAGYAERDGSGFRLGPDGRPIAFTVAIPGGDRPDLLDAMDLVRRHWREVGLNVQVDTEDRSLFQWRKETGDHDANVWPGDNGLLDAMFEPRWYLPINSTESGYAIPWAKWYNSLGSEGEAPPEPVQEQMRLYRRVQAVADVEQRYELMRQILRIAADEFLVMGLNLSPSGYGIVADNFHNVPDKIYDSAVYNNPAPTNPEQYFIEDS
ncbi:ABC transporter substrate-binding protein [Saccharopolyspora sp. 5N708]|uniref:ABC transporter substrate-binding protein n=1 Tax=Saccharopolyspora sp. 5N708 TaxID=3457424 RepID=UPI003FD4DB2E